MIINDLAEDNENEEYGYDLLCKKYSDQTQTQAQNPIQIGKENYPIPSSSSHINSKPIIKPIIPTTVS